MPKIINHEKRRNEIIDVTLDLIVEGGFEAATMREIASRAGFANGALKHYFPGKNDIIRGAYERYLHSIGDLLSEHVGTKRGISALEKAIRLTIPRNHDDATAARVLLSFWERCAFNAENDHDYTQHLTGWKAGYMQYLSEGRKDGDITTDTSDEQLVNEIVFMVMGATITRVVSPTHYDLDLIDSQVSDFIARLKK